MDIYAFLTNGNVVPLTGVTDIVSIDLHPTIALQTTATTTAGSPVLTSVGSTTGLLVGHYAFGPGVPAGARVAGFTTNSVVVLDRPVLQTGTTVNVAFHGVSAADYELCRFDSGTYRDLFTTSTAALGIEKSRPAIGVDDPGFTLATSGVLAADGIVAIPNSAMELDFNKIASTGGGGAEAVATSVVPTYSTTRLTTSDELDHFAPRQLSYYEAVWDVTCVVGDETQHVYLRKALVIGFGNVKPEL
jgi:hypothetical protein